MNQKKIIIAVVIVLALIVAFFVVQSNLTEEVFVQKTVKVPYEYFVLYAKNDKVGVVDKTGKILIEPKYTDIYIPNQSKDVFICVQDEESTVLNKEGKPIYTEYEDVSYLETSDATELVLESEVLNITEH